MKRWLALLLLLGGYAVRCHGDDAPPAHWAFQPVRDPDPPHVQDEAWCKTSVDRFILARLEAAGVQPAPTATRRALIRRATFDLTGLPPTADEIDAFATDTAPKAYARLVDRLLDSPHYGEHWGRHWLDVVRYADTAGETADYPVPVAWRYRNYVIDAFNSDKPYDEFLREQIAGDILARRGPRERYAERVTATGYLAISRRFGFDSENYHHLTIQDTIDTLGQSVLGLTLGCARCHAHKYDPVSMPEYYSLYGIFDSTRYAFPGSEQKQKHRALAPLLPPEESQPRWLEYESKVASLVRQLERHKLSVPGGTLRSLDELDGDFEMQAPAAGGSKGVLVPPWVFEGPIAVTTEAQSPFKNLHPLGRVGASLDSGPHTYLIAQTLHPRRSRENRDVLHVNLDLRIGAQDQAARGAHRFWLGSASAPAVEVLLTATNLSVRTGARSDVIRSVPTNTWQNVQLRLDLGAGTVSGIAGSPGDTVAFLERPLSADWSGTVDYVAIDSHDAAGTPLPAIALDNLGVQTPPIPGVSTTPTAFAATATPDGPAPSALAAQLKEQVGIDGTFEFQDDDTPPATPWGPGPKSVVRIRASAQSPFTNIHPPGRLGVALPNSGDYNGFGQTLPQRWQAASSEKLYASFDFRCARADAGGDGSWRYHLGHGPGGSAAVELFFNAQGFFPRNGDSRERLQTLRVGEWYQVRLTLDLKARQYTGVLAAASNLERTEFSGAFAAGWDGSIDYTFVDSYGHLPGVKPALDVDNFTLRDQALPPFDAPAVALADAERNARREQVAGIRQQIAAAAAEGQRLQRELETLLADGPFDLAYAVSEGTPRNARIQLRGEPEKPGDMAPRGFLKVLGGGTLPPGTDGSGRLELAQWLTQPENPLTARVLVNRIWQYHFGQGLVKTPNDFGKRGQPPTHPELLDHLATQFVRSGWSIKAMHRLIMNSAVYQQRSLFSGVIDPTPDPRAPDDCPVDSPAPASSRARATARLAAAPPTPGTVDPDLYSSFPRRRLGAEETRDAILRVSGALDPSPGRGHPFPAPTTWGYTQHGPFSAVYDHSKRSVYLMTQRIKRHPFLALFDGPDPNASTPERRTSTVPTQALFFLNDPFVHANAAQLATRLLGRAPDDPHRIDAAYRAALGRHPSEAERSEATEFLTAYRSELGPAGNDDPAATAYAALARVLFGSNEFLTVD